MFTFHKFLLQTKQFEYYNVITGSYILPYLQSLFLLLVVGCSCLFSYFSKLFVKSLFFAMCGLWSLSAFSQWSSLSCFDRDFLEYQKGGRGAGSGGKGREKEGSKERKGKRKTSFNLCRLLMDQGIASVLRCLQLRLTSYFLFVLSLEVWTKRSSQIFSEHVSCPGYACGFLNSPVYEISFNQL